MKEIIEYKYICDICKTSYSNKQECEKCEKRHTKPIKIIDYGFGGRANANRYKYPTWVLIKFEDGEEVEYSVDY